MQVRRRKDIERDAMKNVHGHEVMRMMAEAGRSYTRAELRQAIEETFGHETRFHTCSAEALTPDELIDFLASRGKFVESEAGLAMDAGSICNHE